MTYSPRFLHRVNDLGILGDGGMYRLEAMQASRILRMLPYLKFRNANGAHIYTRPTGESAYTLLDDHDLATPNRLEAEGYGPAAVIRPRFHTSQAKVPQRQGPLSVRPPHHNIGQPFTAAAPFRSNSSDT